ncbi:MAG: CRISPR-associated endonuclease Cas3'', partial [bacterium]
METGQPGISVRDHCLNVGCVAEVLLSQVLPAVRALLPASGIATLAALHDVGKVSPGFQCKCPAWMKQHGFGDKTQAWTVGSVSDHARVSQYALQQHLSLESPNLWAAVVGAHHGRLKG